MMGPDVLCPKHGDGAPCLLPKKPCVEQEHSVSYPLPLPPQSVVDQADSGLVRPLGFGEARMHVLRAQFGGTTQAAAVVRLRGELDVTKLRAALRALQARKELLRVDVTEVGDALWFRRQPMAPEAPLTVLPREDDDHWRRLLEAENSRALGAERGLWHVFALAAPSASPQEHELVLLAHHALVDATATHAFFDELLREATEPKRASAEASIQPIADPAELMVRSPGGRGTGDWQEFEARSAKRAEVRAPFTPLAHVAKAPVPERVTKVIPIVPSVNACAAIQRACSSLGLPQSSYIAALYLVALKRQLPEREQLVLSTAMSLREHTGGRITPQDLGCYLAVVSTSHATEQGKPLDVLAREHQRAFALSAMVHGQNPTEVRLDRLRASMDALATADSFLLDFGIAHVTMPLDVRYGGLEVTAFFSSANRAIGSAAAILHSVQLRDRFFLTVNYTSPLQSDAWAGALARDLHALIEAPAL